MPSPAESAEAVLKTETVEGLAGVEVDHVEGNPQFFPPSLHPHPSALWAGDSALAAMPYDDRQLASTTTSIPLHNHYHHQHQHAHPHAHVLRHALRHAHSYPHSHRHASILLSPTADGRFGTMEQIETQVSDLRYLSQAPVALSPTTGGQNGSGTSGTAPGGSGGGGIGYDQTPQPHTHGSPGPSSIGDNSAPSVSASKRKSLDDGSSKQMRSKRNRVSKAVSLLTIEYQRSLKR